MTIEESFKDIEKLLDKMEKSDTGLEELFSMYKEGCELIKQCNESIEKVENEIKLIQ